MRSHHFIHVASKISNKNRSNEPNDCHDLLFTLLLLEAAKEDWECVKYVRDASIHTHKYGYIYM